MYSLYKQMCVVSCIPVFQEGSRIVQYTQQAAEQTLLNLILQNMCFHYCLSLQARGSFTTVCFCRVLSSLFNSVTS